VFEARGGTGDLFEFMLLVRHLQRNSDRLSNQLTFKLTQFSGDKGLVSLSAAGKLRHQGFVVLFWGGTANDEDMFRNCNMRRCSETTLADERRKQISRCLSYLLQCVVKKGVPFLMLRFKRQNLPLPTASVCSKLFRMFWLARR